MGKRTLGLVGEEVVELLDADLDLLGSLEVAGQVGRVAPYLLSLLASTTANAEGSLTKIWPYSFSKR